MLERAGEAGVVPQHADLVEGVVYFVSPRGPDHARAARALVRSARPVADGWVVGVQLPVRLGPASEPEPALYVAAGPEDRYRSTHPGPDELLLVVEVSGPALTYDLTTELDVGGDRIRMLAELEVEALARRDLGVDVVASNASCIFDAELTMAAEHVVKVLGWYDNEWGPRAPFPPRRTQCARDRRSRRRAHVRRSRAGAAVPAGRT